MYLLFRYHSILPSTYNQMGIGEKKVIKSLMIYELEQKAKELEALSKR